MPLAKLADIKLLLNKSTSADSDDALTLLLNSATGMAERLIAVGSGCLLRKTNIVEFPASDYSPGRLLRLRRRPLESISSVVALLSPGLDADFAAADPLVINQDYLLENEGRFGVLERITERWSLRARCNKVIYTAGWLDPVAAAAVISWVTATPYVPGNLVSAVDDDGQTVIYSCLWAHTSSSGNKPTAQSAWLNSESAIWAVVHQVPTDLEQAIRMQVVQLFQNKATAGLINTVNVGGGGSISLAGAKDHPALIDACKRWRISQ